jgi:hypothetical protein
MDGHTLPLLVVQSSVSEKGGDFFSSVTRLFAQLCA